MRKRLAVAVILSIFLIGCASWFGATKPEGIPDGEWNLMQFRTAYNAQFKDARSMANNPAITPTQADIVRKKVEILQQVKPLINAYALVLDAGKPPDPRQEQQIYDMLTSLGAQIERRATK